LGHRSCMNLFTPLKPDQSEESIKFCRRVRKPGENVRPLVVGFYEERYRKSS
jgi:hypothetical protein